MGVYLMIGKIVFILIICLMFTNPKIREYRLLKKQLKVFKNAQTQKTSIWDIVCFIVLPIMLSVVIVFGLGCVISTSIAQVLAIIFAITFLFGYMATLMMKIVRTHDDSESLLCKEVSEDIFVTIMTSSILSLMATILSIAILITSPNIIRLITCILSMCVFSLAFMIIMLLLMVIKRTFIIYSE